MRARDVNAPMPDAPISDATHERRPPRVHGAPRNLLALALALALFPKEARAQLPPDADYSTLASPHFRVTFTPGLESLARHAATVAEKAWTDLTRTLAQPPDGTIDIVIVGDVDVSNGFATPFPSNRIVLYARPPVDDEALGYYTDWIELVVSHELTHIFHLDRAGGFGHFMRDVFGRVPMTWPLFPAVGTPRWNVEGLAVEHESHFTGEGRLNGSFHEMVVRTAVLEDAFDPMSRLKASSPIWPGDQRVYIYGSLFMDYLTRRYGADMQRRLLDRIAGAWLPPFLFFDHVGKGTFGETFSRAYDEWRDTLRTRYAALADSLRAAGLTASTDVVAHGRYALHPRVSADGTRLAYVADDGRNTTATRVVDVASGDVISSRRRNGLGSIAWLNDDAVVTGQLIFHDPYRIQSDLFELSAAGERRITTGARLAEPDVALDGDRIVAVQGGDGTNRLVVYSISTGEIDPLTDYDPGVQWAMPRWSPDGTRIAVSMWTQGGKRDVVVLDTTGAVRVRLTEDRAVDSAPAWSPDGRWILFSSDRSGIANLYAAHPDGTALRQVTNVLTGAFQPDVTPDGRSIHFAEYHADGYHIARMPFDTTAWRAPSPVTLADAYPRSAFASDGAIAQTTPATALAADTFEIGAARPYSAWSTVLPTFWTPIYLSNEGGEFLGAATSSHDLVGRHSYAVYAAIDPGQGRWLGSLSYAYAGFGNPILGLDAVRDWDSSIGVVFQDSIFRPAIESENTIAASATLLRRRWRSSASITGGIERVLVHREIVNPLVPGARHPDEKDNLTGLFASAGFANYRQPAFAISREDGISLSLVARTLFEDVVDDRNPNDYRELRGRLTAYRSLPISGFAHHVAALRASGLLRTGDGAEPTSIGGTSGTPYDALGFQLGAGARLLPVRGFERGVRRGTNAWTASAEYRFPLALVGRRPRFSPFYIDRIAGTLFVDAGDAWCTGRAADRYNDCVATAPRSPLIGAGAELTIDLGLSSIFSASLRAGFGVPLHGPGGGPLFYVQFGPSF